MTFYVLDGTLVPKIDHKTVVTHTDVFKTLLSMLNIKTSMEPGGIDLFSGRRVLEVGSVSG